MFDTPPSNLPLEPLKPKPTAPPSPAPIPVPKAVKEPEDIFSGMDTAAEQRAANAGMEVVHESSSKSPLFFAVAGLIGLIVLGGVGYGVWALVLQPKAAPVETVQPSPQPVVPAPRQEIEQPPYIEPTPVTQAPGGVPLPATSTDAEPEPEPEPETPVVTAPTEGTDEDGDGLTDAEERLYGTRRAKADSDEDGFTDGAEVIAIYDPMQEGESLVKNFGISARKWNGMNMLLPTSWAVVPVPENPAGTVIDTATKTRLTFETRSNAARQSVENWVGPTASEMKSFTTKNGLKALQSADGLTTYLGADDTILIITYDLNGDPSYEYRTTVQMVIQSIQAHAR